MNSGETSIFGDVVYENSETVEQNTVSDPNSGDSLTVVQIYMLGMVVGLLIVSLLTRRWHS